MANKNTFKNWSKEDEQVSDVEDMSVEEWDMPFKEQDEMPIEDEDAAEFRREKENEEQLNFERTLKNAD